MGNLESRMKNEVKDNSNSKIPRNENRYTDVDSNNAKSISKEHKWKNILEGTLKSCEISKKGKENSNVQVDVQIALSVSTLKIIQHHVAWLLHAEKCQNEKIKCFFENCITMKNALKHIKSCETGNGCPHSHCSISKRIIYHLKICEEDMCPVCLPSKSDDHRRACELLIDINEPLENEKVLLLNEQGDNLKFQKQGKEWHKTFHQESRNYIVHNLIESTISISNPKRFLDLEPIIPNLIASGRKVETYFYELADSKLEYCQNIDKIIKIMKQLPLNTTLPLLGQCLGDSNENICVPDTKCTAPESVSSTENPSEKKRSLFFKPIELRKALLPTFEKLYNQEPEALPFRKPVDPEALEIPDYLHLVNNPIDLSTIKHKLDMLVYIDPWEYVDDVWTMFNNAWIYNPKTSRTYRYCTKLSEVFEQEIDPVMKDLGFCCGRKFTFNPEELSCYAYGKHICTIPRNEIYRSYQDIYNFCETCFSQIPSNTVLLGDDLPEPQIPVRKEEFQMKRNNGLKSQTFVYCKDCKRKSHTNCVLSTNFSSQVFTCDGCMNAAKSEGKN